MKDVMRFAQSDPAANGSCFYVYKSYKGIKAMMYYRVSNGILSWNALEHVERETVETIVRTLCEIGKVETGIDIHPLAQIGEGCVIDHGVGTKITVDVYENNTVVMGETVIIGKNCTILNDVVIGAEKVNDGKSEGRRHPKIGNDVTICAGVKILGKIKIGDNVIIGPGCRIVNDIPSNSKVFIVNQIQVISIKEAAPLIIDGVVFDGNNLLLYGENIKDVKIILLDSQYDERDDLDVVILERKQFCVSFNIKISNKEKLCQTLKDNHLKIMLGERYFFISADVIERYLCKLLK